MEFLCAMIKGPRPVFMTGGWVGVAAFRGSHIARSSVYKGLVREICHFFLLLLLLELENVWDD